MLQLINLTVLASITVITPYVVAVTLAVSLVSFSLVLVSLVLVSLVIAVSFVVAGCVYLLLKR